MSKLVDAVEAGEECMLLPSGTDREESNSVEVLSAGGECKFLNRSWYRVRGENDGGKAMALTPSAVAEALLLLLLLRVTPFPEPLLGPFTEEVEEFVEAVVSSSCERSSAKNLP